MVRGWLRNGRQLDHLAAWRSTTSHAAKAAEEAKMGDQSDMAWMATRLREQGCEILAIKTENERLRKLVEAAYKEGINDGWLGDIGRPHFGWEHSNARKALDNTP